jgi:hypothetical protein
MLAIPIVVASAHYILMLRPSTRGHRILGTCGASAPHRPGTSTAPSIKGENVDEIGCISRRRKW